MKNRQRPSAPSLGPASALLTMMVLLTACTEWVLTLPFDSGVDAEVEGDATPDGDADADAEVDGDADVDSDIEGDSDRPECIDGEFQCVDVTARVCEDGAFQTISACPLGCNESTRECRVPSNVPDDVLNDLGVDLGDLLIDETDTTVLFDTETGSITAGAHVIRGPIEGRDDTTGTVFRRAEQGEGSPGLGIFGVGDFTVAEDVTVEVLGDGALIVVATNIARIDGLVSVAADGQLGGPGGFSGGDPDAPGLGDCGGQVGAGSNEGSHCTSGGGGGGFGGDGGSGGDCTCEHPNDFPGGLGGLGGCGTSELVPLVGGSGGAGGAGAVGSSDTYPGTGGGGGGAFQISARERIELGPTGGLTAGGGGGEGGDAASGAGGGAGGALLVEAATVVVADGAVLAANGGGGGGGDCT